MVGKWRFLMYSKLNCAIWWYDEDDGDVITIHNHTIVVIVAMRLLNLIEWEGGCDDNSSAIANVLYTTCHIRIEWIQLNQSF